MIFFPRANPALRLVLPALLCAGVCAAGAMAQPRLGNDRQPGLPNVTPEPLKNIELKNRLGNTIPLDLRFTTAEGREILLKDLFNRTAGQPASADAPARRPVVLMLMYFRCPMLCPMVLDRMTQQFKSVGEGRSGFAVGTEFDALVVSFDARDTVKDAANMKAGALAVYTGLSASDPALDPAAKARLQSISDGWNFLVGSPEQSKTLADAVGFSYRYLSETGEFAHGAAFFILTPEGKVSRYVTDLTGSSTNLRLSLVDASAGSIGTWTDQLMLRCLHFNPSDGTYSLAVMQGVRLLAGVGVAALGGMIAAHLVRERRRRRFALHPAQPARASDSPLSTITPDAARPALATGPSR